MRLVVNIPTYNEKENIEEVIKKVLAQAKNLKDVDLHILVSDGHSPDGTGDIVKKFARSNPKVHYLDVKEKGLGIGIVKGHRYAIQKLKAEVLAQMDGDLSHDPSSLVQMVDQIKKGQDLVIGSRLIKGGKNLLGWHRRLFTRGSAFFCKLSWGTFSISEYTNSYRVFTKDLFEKIDFKKIPWRSKTYIIQPAFLYAAISARAKIKEIPITFIDRKKGYSKAKIISYTLEVILFGIKVRIKKSKTFIKFLMVGLVGYLVNAVTLGILYRGQIYSWHLIKFPLLSFIPDYEYAPRFLFVSADRLFIASIIAIELSIISNFLLHDNWTFKYRGKAESTLRRFLKFNISSSASPAIQLTSILFFARVFKLHEQVGLAVGVVIGLSVNYFLNLFWVWKQHAVEPKGPLAAKTP